MNNQLSHYLIGSNFTKKSGQNLSQLFKKIADRISISDRKFYNMREKSDRDVTPENI
jgi:hypothetical protein